MSVQDKIRKRPTWLKVLAAGVATVITLSLSAAPSNVSYDSKTQQVSVAAAGQPLLEVLEQLARATGWHIFLEPGANPVIETEFENVAVGRALEFLVGRMNYALVPQQDGPTKLYVFRTSREQATLAVGVSPPAITIQRIGNELIVTVEPGTDIDALAARLGANVVGQLPGTHTYRLRFEDEAAADSARAALSEEAGVGRVDYNYVVPRPNPDQSQTQGPTPPVRLSLNPPSGDKQVVIGLVDTGVQPLGGGLDQFILAGKSLAGDTTLPTDELTHGTSMAQTILRSIEQTSAGGTAVQILPVDIYGPNGSSSSFDVALGIATAVNAGADIINLSLGSYGTSGYLQDVIQEATRQGIVIFAAAGNEPVTNPVYPAAYPEAIAVTAIEQNRLAPYANHGAFVDMGAPGSSVVYFDGQPFVISGTSTATAYASGLAAAIAEQQHLTPGAAAQTIAERYAVHFSDSH
jgi:hypothetical protein